MIDSKEGRRTVAERRRAALKVGFTLLFVTGGTVIAAPGEVAV
jgi:hypothetical protein